jgi:hypothetical protein
MTQKTFERVRRIELQIGVAPSHYEANIPPAQARASDADEAQAGAQAKAREAVRL